MFASFLMFIGVCILLTIIKKDLGLWLMLLIGLLADPVRKVTPNSPFYISAIFVVILLIVYLQYMTSKSRRESIFQYIPNLKTSFKLFCLFFIINAIRPLFVSISFIPLVLMGSAQYIGLFAATLLGFNLVKDEKSIIRFADVFVITLVPFLFSVVLEYWGFKSQFFGVMSIGKWVQYHTGGEGLSMFCGVFRFPEGMGWFAMVAAVSSLYLIIRKKNNLLNLFYVSSFALSGFCILLSGRRKFYIGVFAFILVFIIVAFRKNLNKAVMYLLLFAAACGIFYHYVGRSEKIELYIKSGESGFSSTKERLSSGVIGSVYWAIRRDGFFGRGLGTTTQGSRHIKVETGVRGYIEAGPGKVISDLGVPGFIAFIMILLAYLKGVYKRVLKGRLKDAREVTGVFLLAMVLTQIAEFSISHQIFGDPLVAVLTGLMAGFLLAVPRFMSVDSNVEPVKTGG